MWNLIKVTIFLNTVGIFSYCLYYSTMYWANQNEIDIYNAYWKYVQTIVKYLLSHLLSVECKYVIFY